ncbi:MAG: acetylglutamate kinase [Oscillospiraceae bacterium]|nr:acetylglutamate kinase [Oscillospiraceae bacterium]
MYFPEPSYKCEKAHPCGEHCKCPDFYRQFILTNGMRLAWEQHIYWTRLFLISTAERLADLKDTTARLMQNPKDIAKVFEPYYPADVTREIARLLTEHLQIGGDLITALRDKKAAEAAELNRRWYLNADQMAAAFAAINPNYKLDEMRQMLRTHLDLTTKEVTARLAGRYAEDIEAFGKVEREAMMMADYFTQGIFKEFPHKFV